MTFINLAHKPSHKLVDGYSAKFVHSNNMTFAYWDIEAGKLLPEHVHPHEQVAHVLEGQFELTIAGKTQIMQPGELAIIPSNAKHSGKAITKCRVLDVFYPIREDYLKFT